MSAVTEVFRLPELCAIIFDYLSNEEIYRLQNLSRGSRGFLSDSKSWKERIMHHAVFDGETVVPRLHNAREGDNEDPKKVDWIYTSGEFEGGIMRNLNMRRQWPIFPVMPEVMTAGYIRAGSARPGPSWSINSDSDAESSGMSAPEMRVHQSIQAAASASSPATASSGMPSSATSSSVAISFLTASPATSSSATISSETSSTGTPAVSAPSATSFTSTQTAAQATATPTAQTNHPNIPHFGRRNRGSAYSAHETQMQGVMLNWILEAKFPKWKYYPISNMLGLEQEVPMDEFFVTSDASYRPLFLMYPPLSEVTVMDWRSRMFEVSNKSGVTMGDVVDALMNGEAEPSEGGGLN